VLGWIGEWLGQTHSNITQCAHFRPPRLQVPTEQLAKVQNAGSNRFE
jgi:hypothetical protein